WLQTLTPFQEQLSPKTVNTNVEMPGTAMANIDTIAQMERDFAQRRTWTERLGDGIADFIGTMSFILLHLLFFALWFSINTGRFGIKAFDPFPYVLLTMIVSMEGVLLSTFVLMKQNRMSRRADQRDHLNLQIDLLSEKELTKMLQLQRLICQRLGITEVARDTEAAELAEHTAVDRLAKELDQRLPE
ncbi:MAG TPA: DUF1003 domain-containing protein, partial [Bryobacteraceae bacterium]|nr:DUF1003 domain-containing protein [Bryobacteraceae bacterium]